MRNHLFTVVSLALSSICLAAPLQKRSNLVTTAADSYDFVIVGGGLAGLVLGNRLSADGTYTVLVLEAGSDGEEYETLIETPGLAYYGDLWDIPINWAFYTTPQSELNGYSMEWPRGKVLGGSSAINGLYWTRPSSVEVDAWQSMLGGMYGSENWSWDSMLAAMKTSETFTPPSAAIASEADINYVASSHGETGPIDSSWPAYTFPIVGDWCEAAAAAGVPYTDDAYNGVNSGTYVALSSIDPSTYTRSTSKTGYLDPLPAMANYDVMTNAFVSKVVFGSNTTGNLVATGVEYTLDGGSSYQTVNAGREVILSGGTVGSPWVLQNSGIGPSSVLGAAGVDVLYDSPSVGQHLMDHLSVQTLWASTEESAGAIYEAGGGSNAAFLSYVNDAVAFVDSSTLFGADAGAFQAQVLADLNNYAPTDDALLATSYNLIGETTAKTIFPSNSGLVEILLENTSANDTVFIQVTLQHPYSQGSVEITSDNPMTYPSINPNYLTNPADQRITIEGLKLARKICETEPLASILTELTPGSDVQTDEEWLEWMRGNVFTEFHPAATCAMMPQASGGVVDAELIVYGTENVRVIDSSILPVMMSAHLQAITYGIAEQGSQIILASQ